MTKMKNFYKKFFLQQPEKSYLMVDQWCARCQDAPDFSSTYPNINFRVALEAPFNQLLVLSLLSEFNNNLKKRSES